jgi:hypothetical protein
LSGAVNVTLSNNQGECIIMNDDCQAFTFMPASLPNARAGVPYAQTLTVSGGLPPYEFALPPDTALPAGLSLSPTGVLSGTPTQFGSFSFVVEVEDDFGCFDEQFYTLTINPPCTSITINPTSLPSGLQGAAYNQTLTATGGTPPYSFSLDAGSLPPGLSLAAGGALTGTPTAAGSFNFTVKVTDQSACTATRAYTLAVCSAITVSPASLPSGFVGLAYNQALTQSGGAGAINWSLSAGALPGGLSLSAGGVITGTPTTAGTFSFSVLATDSNGCTGTRQYSVLIGGAGLQFYPLPFPVRLLDTRAGFAGCDAPGAPIAGGTAGTRTQTVAGRTCSGVTIPASARAVTGHITTVQSGGGYLTLYPSDATQPTVANSNYLPNEIVNNVFTVGLGAADGAFKIFVTSNTHIVVDVTGYYAPPGAGGLYFHPLPTPIRLLETRAGFTGCFAPGAPLQGGAEMPQQARLTCGGVTIPANAQAIVGNATVVQPGAGGFLTLWPSGNARPTVASSNFLAGQIVNGPFTVGLGLSGQFMLYSTATTHIVVDVLGYYSPDATDSNGAGLLFNPLPSPVRLLETRSGFAGCSATNAPLQGGTTRTQQARGFCTIASNAAGIVGNATVVNTQSGFLTFWPSSATQPNIATSNYAAGQIWNRHFTVGLGPADGAFKIFPAATTDLVVDVAGYFAP